MADLSDALGLTWWTYEVDGDPGSLTIQWELPGAEPIPVLRVPMFGIGPTLRIAALVDESRPDIELTVLGTTRPGTPPIHARKWSVTTENRLPKLMSRDRSPLPDESLSGPIAIGDDGVILWGQKVKFDQTDIGLGGGDDVILRVVPTG